MHHKYKVIPQTINNHNIIKFQAWADSHVNFPYHERAPLTTEIDEWVNISQIEHTCYRQSF